MEYPDDLPKIPVSNNLELCLTCGHVWLEANGKPDFNHCSPMVDPRYAFNNLTQEQQERFRQLRSEARCPLYIEKN